MMQSASSSVLRHISTSLGYCPNLSNIERSLMVSDIMRTWVVAGLRGFARFFSIVLLLASPATLRASFVLFCFVFSFSLSLSRPSPRRLNVRVTRMLHTMADLIGSDGTCSLHSPGLFSPSVCVREFAISYTRNTKGVEPLTQTHTCVCVCVCVVCAERCQLEWKHLKIHNAKST